MRPPRRWDRYTRWAALGVGAGVLLCFAAGLGASRLGPVPSAGTPPGGAATLPAPDTARGAAPDPGSTAAVEAAPFRADREPADSRYLLPEERRPGRDRRDPALDRLRLVGTATRDGGGLAAFELGGRDVRVLQPGQDLEGFRVLRIEPGNVTLRGEDTTVVFRVERPGGERGGT